MVEFRFDLSPLFTQPIVKVTSNLLPHTFRGDRRQCLDATSKMSEIIDRLGQLSATAQKLNKPVTTAKRLRMSENQTIYLLADVNSGKNGSVIGLLKVGTKDLYLFDESGQTRKVENAPSILDFYIHESRQRAGLGKDLFETMLADENWTPVKCSVDRPSEKLLGFLNKHYGLSRTIPQSNNFVLYEGFFNGGSSKLQQQHTNGGMHITNSPNTQLFGATYLGDDNNKRRSQRQVEAPNLATQITQISPVGRYGARRPTCSMAEKKASEVSLTPSQAVGHDKSNIHKHPLDALSKMSIKQSTVERRSGLQEVDDEYIKQNIFRKPFSARNLPTSEGVPSQQQQLKYQHQYPPTNLTQSQEQMQTKAQLSAAHPANNGKNQFDHIIHSGTTPKKSGAESESNQHTVEFVTENFENVNINDHEITQHDEPDHRHSSEHHNNYEEEDLQTQADIEPTASTHTTDLELTTIDQATTAEHEESSANTPSQPSKGTSVFEMENRKTAPTFHLSKQHTGMKNRSYGVGMAVTPTTKMEFDQEAREDFGVVKINRPVGKQPLSPNANEETMSTVSSSGAEGLTDQGYYDLKFYHNKLW